MRKYVYWSCWVFLLLIVSCTQRNPLAVEDSNLIIGQCNGSKIEIPGDSTEYLFRQEFSWDTRNLNNPKFAIRFTTTNADLPEGVFTDAEGWVYHYQAGADTSVPLSSPDCERTIWTTQKYYQTFIKSHQQNIAYFINKIEIKCLDRNNKAYNAEKVFNTERIIQTKILSPNVPNGAECGDGIRVKVQEVTGDIFMDGLYADHFMVRVNIVDTLGTMIQEGEWVNTNTFENMRDFVLNQNTTPHLTVNTNPAHRNQIQVYCVTHSGVQEGTPQSTIINVKDTYYPVACIYPLITTGLGDNHFTYDIPQVSNFNFLEEYHSDGYHFAQPLFIKYSNEEFSFEAIGSNNFRIDLNWGFNGEFTSNYPVQKPRNELLNSNAYYYYSEVRYYYLQLDLEANFLPALANHIVTLPGEGNWIKLPANHPQAKRIVMSNLYTGEHIFKIKVEDLSGKISQEPAEYKFKIVEPIPFSEKQGILIVDDEQAQMNISPDLLIDNFYTQALQNISMSKTVIDLDSLSNVFGYNSPYFDDGEIISSCELQKYKYIIWHSDNPTFNNTYRFNKSNDAINLALKNGTTFILSSGAVFKKISDEERYTRNMFTKYFGISPNKNDVLAVSSNQNNYPYMVGAMGLANLPTLNLNLSETQFCPIVRTRQGLSWVTYFLNSTATPIYSFICKPVGTGTYDPTQAQYDLYNGKTIGLKKVTGNTTAYLLGFPLSYMNLSEVTAFFNQVIN